MPTSPRSMPRSARRPMPLVAAAAVVAAQALALVTLGGAALLDLTGDRLEVGLSAAVFFLGYGAVLLGSSWALLQGAGWARGPALITQLIELGLAYNVRAEPWLAVGLAVVAAVGLAALVHPDSIEALEHEAGE
ncbi:MAG: hypothetical protein WB767_08100 [Nocardioides sp.]